MDEQAVEAKRLKRNKELEVKKESYRRQRNKNQEKIKIS
jgi:hypothetical protein